MPTSVTAPKLRFSIGQNASESANITTNNTITILILGKLVIVLISFCCLGASESGKTTACKQLRYHLMHHSIIYL